MANRASDGRPVVVGAELSERIRSSTCVKPVFIVGPPRSGTTLIAQVLAYGDDVLSLSEPFGAWRIPRPWCSRALFQCFQTGFRWHTALPSSRCPAQFFSFMRDCALRNGRSVLVVKEVFHGFGLPPPWWNVDLLDAIVESGAAVVAIVRDPFDLVSSTIKLVRRCLCGWSGFVLRFAIPSLPRFTDDEDIVRRAAGNWSRYADWVRQRDPFLVRYEELVGDPATAVRRVCTHTGIRFHQDMLAARSRPPAFAGIGDPGALLDPQPVHARSVGCGRRLPAGHLAVIRDLCARGMADFGYSV